MAFQKRHGYIQGKIGDLVYYTSEGKKLVRRAVSTEQKDLKADGAYAGRRETSSEFGNVSRAGKLFREVLFPFVHNASVNRLSARVNGLMSTIKNSDTLPRGMRTVGHALEVAKHLHLFKGFEFNPPSVVRNLLSCSTEIDPATNSIVLRHFDPHFSFHAPTHATHVELTGCMARFDFTAGTGEMCVTPRIEFAVNVPQEDTYGAYNLEEVVVLTPDEVLTGTGITLYLLKVVFLMRMPNGEEFEVRNGAGNGVVIL